MSFSIGFVGIGDMGFPMARRLVSAGHRVTICDSNPAAVAAFGGDVGRSTSPAGLAGNDAIILMVATDEQLTVVADAIAPSLIAGTQTLVLVMSTCAPATVHAIRDRLGPMGARVVDAPVSGGRRGAEEGTLSVMVGGDPADVEAARPLIRHMGDTVFECGPLGSGQTVKLLNNAIGLTNLYLMAEIMDVAGKLGIDRATLLPILEASSGRNALTKDLGRTHGLLATWSETQEIFDLLGRIVRKDLANASSLADESAVAAPVLAALAHLFERCSIANRDDWYRLASE